MWFTPSERGTCKCGLQGFRDSTCDGLGPPHLREGGPNPTRGVPPPLLNRNTNQSSLHFDPQ